MNPFDVRYADPNSYRERRSDLIHPPYIATPSQDAGFSGTFYPPITQQFPNGAAAFGGYHRPPFVPPRSGGAGQGRGGGEVLVGELGEGMILVTAARVEGEGDLRVVGEAVIEEEEEGILG
ncbi:hypothetical protein HPP92_026141 [Vanilla planifolia]|uniref:Uncharacterized protein n=1 Tax=Vanilla planifolia TaxID=51239 RepID=A0A835PE42_VANPL|nr:hypothetical protein HPP92_026141 [Vanilla planifolia]